MKEALIIEDKFSSHALKMRQNFLEKFRDPRRSFRERFVWDYWHVPGQYTLVRTPAQSFFSPSLMEAFLQELIGWGERELGCRAISEPWLSYYVDGCEQKIHADVPHGPWSFVFSLTDWTRRRFQGGQTFFAKPELLEFWSKTGPRDFHEEETFFTDVPARFNRLLVFDPRIPHGVNRVQGVQDPREARVVVHGWFTRPNSYLDGPHSPARAQRVIEGWQERLVKEANKAKLEGFFSVRAKIQSDGRVSAAKILKSSLRYRDRSRSSERWQVAQVEALKNLRFSPVKAGSSFLTIPLCIG